jgi:hypothetical protein
MQVSKLRAGNTCSLLVGNATVVVEDMSMCTPPICCVCAGVVCRLLKATAVLRRAHGDPFRLVNNIPALKRNFNYSLR